jgi:DNA topoisomerase-1
MSNKKILFLVESPGKVNKIKSYLGNAYIVASSVGHICDLIKSKENPLGVDIDNNFKPTFKNSDDKKKVIADLKTKAKSCSTIMLCQDKDREGEAIAHHVNRIINGGKTNNIKRVTFTEITKNAILTAIENFSQIDINMFYAYCARRIVDRVVGFKITPQLWKFVQATYSKGSLSAGRVQSCVLKLIIDREKEIEDFENSMYYNLKGNL